VLHVTVATWIGNAAAVVSGTWGAVTRRAQQSGFSRTTVYTHAQRVVQAIASEQAGGISYASVNSFLDTFGPKIRPHQPRHTVAHTPPE